MIGASEMRRSSSPSEEFCSAFTKLGMLNFVRQCRSSSNIPLLLGASWKWVLLSKPGPFWFCFALSKCSTSLIQKWKSDCDSSAVWWEKTLSDSRGLPKSATKLFMRNLFPEGSALLGSKERNTISTQSKTTQVFNSKFAFSSCYDQEGRKPYGLSTTHSKSQHCLLFSAWVILSLDLSWWFSTWIS